MEREETALFSGYGQGDPEKIELSHHGSNLSHSMLYY